MINLDNKEKCCGCNACVQKCPQHCITMIKDNEGFLYPQIEKENCINCHLCEKVCPYYSKNRDKEPIITFAAKNFDLEKRLKSSSGGIFVSLAESIIERDGIVFGASFDNEHSVKHISINKKEDIHLLMGSKYVQSYIGDTYKLCEKFLQQNKYVLFSGTSCQILGLNLFLRKDYKNLITVEVVCHGVPSPEVWRRYLKEEISEISNLSDSVEISFRDKNLGWEKYSFSIYDKLSKKVLKSELHHSNIFMRAFLSNIILRKSCYNCPAKAGKSNSDITLADFWGIDKVLPDFYDKDGVSLVLVNSSKGVDFLNNNSILKIEIPFKKAIEYNKAYFLSPKENKKRKQFFYMFLTENVSVKGIIMKMLNVSIFQRIKNKIKRIIKKIR